MAKVENPSVNGMSTDLSKISTIYFKSKLISGIYKIYEPVKFSRTLYYFTLNGSYKS